MAFEKFNLTGKTALITGAAGLLGLQHAIALLESDAEVMLTDINILQINKARDYLTQNFDPKKITSAVMDVTNLDNINAVAKTLCERNVRIDILINNAAIDPKVKEGILVENSRIENFCLDQWNFEISVGLTGAFLCSQIFGTLMAKDNKGGVILNIASDLSVFSPDQRLYKKNGLADEMQPVKPITYSVIKSGLIGLTRYLATYWADKNVRCNALSPGGVFNGQDPDFVRRLSSLIPLGRMASKDEYISAIKFLTSDASSYMNGQNIIIDGGRSVW